jgi:hypothetical protein
VRSAAFVLFSAVAACGGKVEITRMEGGDPRAGFVICGDAGPCDVGSGNQCYSCTGVEPLSCHTLDLPTRCDEPSTVVRRECDGPEECKGGKACSADAYSNWLCR